MGKAPQRKANRSRLLQCPHALMEQKNEAKKRERYDRLIAKLTGAK